MRMTMKKLTQGATRLLVLALALGLAGGALADASLVSYLSFDTTGSNGVILQRDGGSVDPVQVESGYVNYTTTENAKFSQTEEQSGCRVTAQAWFLSIMALRSVFGFIQTLSATGGLSAALDC